MKGKQDEEEGSSSQRTWMKHLKDWLNFIYILPLMMFNSLLSIITGQPRLPSIKNFKEEEEGSINTNNDKRSLICSSKWSQIEDDVFGLILKRLCLSDYLRTQVVCSGWRSNVARSIANNNKCCPPFLPELPLVFLQTNDSSKYSSFFDLSTKTVFRRSGSSQFGCCHGTIQGWLIMVDDQASDNNWTGNCIRSIFFFNPLTKAKILMPSSLQCEGRVTKIVASTKPSDPNCVVACLFVDVNMLALSGISDESWTFIKGSHQTEEWIIFQDIEILDGKLYALNHPMFDSILVCDLQNKPIKPKLLAAENPSAEDYLVDQSHIVKQVRYLAIDASSGELLLIYLFEELISYGGNNENGFSLPNFVGSKVFKFNFTGSAEEEEEEEEAEWIEVKDLGNRILFVGGCKSLVVSNIGLHGPQDLIKENCIYFTCKVHIIDEGSEQWKFIRIGRYCESDKRMDYYACKSSVPNNVFSSVWFVPSF